MIYTDIQGWFSEEGLYARIVREAPAVAMFAEVGCWLGKSTCYLAQAIKESGKSIQLFAVDTWEGSANEPELLGYVGQHGGSVLHLFRANMEQAGVGEIVQPLVGTSLATAQSLGNLCRPAFDFVFIDADHTYAAVKADIEAWRPLVKAGGTLAGHDWNTYGDVQRAVRDTLGDDFTVEGNSWVHRVQRLP